MYSENVITSCCCHNIFTIVEISVPYRSKKKKKMLSPQHFHNNFTTNVMWQIIFDG